MGVNSRDVNDYQFPNTIHLEKIPTVWNNNNSNDDNKNNIKSNLGL